MRNLTDFKVEWIVEDLLGGSANGDKAQLAKLASPGLHASAKTPPMLIVHGKDDPIVPVEQSEKLHEKLCARGVDSTLHVIEGAGHGDGDYWNTPLARERVGAFLDRVLRGGGRV